MAHPKTSSCRYEPKSQRMSGASPTSSTNTVPNRFGFGDDKFGVEGLDRQSAPRSSGVRQVIVAHRDPKRPQPVSMLDTEFNCMLVGVAKHRDFFAVRPGRLKKPAQPSKAACIDERRHHDQAA